MNINQALKRKNELAGKLKVLDSRLAANARWLKGNTPQYQFGDVMTERKKVMIDLVDLKAAISRASQPIVGKILEMSELKAFIASFRHISVSKGLEANSYRANQSVLEYDSAMNERDKDLIAEESEARIRELQDDIDHFNATTEI
jgi:hypothetical protein